MTAGINDNIADNVVRRKVKYNTPMRKRLPEAMIIGEIKCGYKTLSAILDTHPQIISTRTKTRNDFFFSNYSKGLEWYADKMPKSKEGQVVIDTNSYFGIKGKTVCNRIKSFKEDIKLIVVLCEPVKRLVSHFKMSSITDRSLATHGLEDYVINHEDGEIQTNNEFVQRGLYKNHMNNWLDCFSQRQIHIVNGENFLKNHLDELTAIENYLNVEKYFNKDNIFYDRTKGLFCYVMKDGDKNCLPHFPTKGYKLLSVKTKEKLREFYKPYNEQFMTLVGRTFQW